MSIWDNINNRSDDFEELEKMIEEVQEETNEQEKIIKEILKKMPDERLSNEELIKELKKMTIEQLRQYRDNLERKEAIDRPRRLM